MKKKKRSIRTTSIIVVVIVILFVSLLSVLSLNNNNFQSIIRDHFDITSTVSSTLSFDAVTTTISANNTNSNNDGNANDVEDIQKLKIDETISSKNDKNIASKILWKSYNDTYAHIINECGINSEGNSSQIGMIRCLKNVYEKSLIISSTTSNNNYNVSSRHNSITTAVKQEKNYPWWFHTLLRDSIHPYNGLMGKHHHLSSQITNPKYEMCTMGKIGTTQWRKVFCLLDPFSQSTLCKKLNMFNPTNNQMKEFIQHRHEEGGIINLTKAQSSAFSTVMKENKKATTNTTTTGTINNNNTVINFLFIRDPLERFLSAFLDKCIVHRLTDVHCEPLVLWNNEKHEKMKRYNKYQLERRKNNNITKTSNNDNNSINKQQRQSGNGRRRRLSSLHNNLAKKERDMNAKILKHKQDYMKKPSTVHVGLVKNSKKFFEAYVDTIPLKWNMHFIPQSLFCNGLFRSYIPPTRREQQQSSSSSLSKISDKNKDDNYVQYYDYVGKMDVNFYDDVYELGKFDDKITTGYNNGNDNDYDMNMKYVLNKVFHLDNVTTATTTSSSSSSSSSLKMVNNTGKETSAILKVEEYYTAKTIKIVLEYLSIDYISLNLPVPEWAIRILEDGDDEI